MFFYINICFFAHLHLSSKYQFYWYVNKLDWFLKNNVEIPKYYLTIPIVQIVEWKYIGGETVTVLA
jgi:hypothetical protein